MNPLTRDRQFELAVMLFLLAALMLGGASSAGHIGRAIVQLAAPGLIWWSLLRLRDCHFSGTAKAGLALLVAILLLPLIQLIPLSPGLWLDMPGREDIGVMLTTMNVEPGWLGISLWPSATLASWLALLPACAVFLATLSLSEESRLRLCLLVVAFAALCVLIGAIQVGGASSRTLYFYQNTNVGSAVGFFSNRNHLATLFLMAIPIVTLFFRSAGRIAPTAQARIGRRIAVVSVVLILILGIVFTGSRAGIVLLLPIMALTLAVSMRSSFGIAPLKLLGSVLAVGLIVGVATVYGPFYERIMERSVNLEDEARIWAAPISLDAGWALFPFGSGFGTFDPVFRVAAGDTHLGVNYVNHAHNDYLELWLTGGLPAMLLLAAGLVWLVRVAVLNWRLKTPNPSAISRTAAVLVLAVVLHSLVDYPVRTVAISSLFAMACALQLAPVLPKRRQIVPTGQGNPAPRRFAGPVQSAFVPPRRSRSRSTGQRSSR